MRTGTLIHLGLAGALAALVACSAVAKDDAASGVSADTEAPQPLLGPTWTNCWIEKDTSTNDAFFQRHSVKCHYDVPAAKQPIKPRIMTVEIHDAKGGVGWKQLDQTPGQDVVVDRVGNDGFPLQVYAHVSSEDFQAVGLDGGGLIDGRLSIANADAATADHPLAIKQPFDLWPVVVIQKADFFALELDRRPIDIAPFVYGQATDAPSDGTASGYAVGDFGAGPGDSKTYYFIAPKQGALTAKYQAASEIPGVRIDAPGYYVADANEFRKATEDEASGAGPAPAALDASAEAATPVVADAGPPRDCGVDGKRCCGGSNGGYGGTCDPGSFCMDGNNICVSCGGAGQKCCGGPNNNGYGGTCSAGSFCMDGNNICVSCGGAGQKCCGGPNNNGYGGTCSAGSFCMDGNNSCVACGGVGQKCCGGPNNNGYGGTCDSGATCQAGNNVCVANP